MNDTPKSAGTVDTYQADSSPDPEDNADAGVGGGARDLALEDCRMSRSASASSCCGDMEVSSRFTTSDTRLLSPLSLVRNSERSARLLIEGACSDSTGIAGISREALWFAAAPDGGGAAVPACWFG